MCHPGLPHCHPEPRRFAQDDSCSCLVPCALCLVPCALCLVPCAPSLEIGKKLLGHTTLEHPSRVNCAGRSQASDHNESSSQDKDNLCATHALESHDLPNEKG